MTEHEELKEICDKIGFRYPYAGPAMGYLYYFSTRYNSFMNYDGKLMTNVREIIFTTEFKDCLIEYIRNNDLDVKKGDYMNGWINYVLVEIMNHLDNPVEYLHNLINN